MQGVIDIDEGTINLANVVYVGPVYGDPSLRRYEVWFTGRSKITINHDKYPREKLIAKWKVL